MSLLPTRRGETSPSLTRRAIAVVVLIAAGWIVLKVVIGVVTALASTIAVVLAVVAVIWAIRAL